jgi:hypothetical protein
MVDLKSFSFVGRFVTGSEFSKSGTIDRPSSVIGDHVVVSSASEI